MYKQVIRILMLFGLIGLSIQWVKAQTPFSGGTGYSFDPFIIANKADLDALADSVNKGIIYYQTSYYELDTDIINVPFTSVIGTHNHPFMGNFNGKNKTILVDINLISKDTVGLFGFLNSAFISNLTIRGSIKGNNFVGGICGFNNISNINNCFNYATILGDSYVGGICGYSDGYISNCSNHDTVLGESNVGGICGFNHGANSYNINLGVIKTEAYYIGGICGYDNGTPIEVCQNTQNICISIDTGTIYIGGICGKNIGLGTNISNCVNIGNLGISGGMAYIGGICGGNNSGGNIFNTFNAGNIRDGDGYFGGIAGKNLGNIATNINVGYVDSTSYAYGAISSINSGTFSSNYYDKQMCVVKGINDTDIINSAVGMFTFELTNGNLPDFNFNFMDWSSSSGLYPKLYNLELENISKVSSSPIFLDTTTNYVNNVDSVSRDFKVSTQNSVSWHALRGNQILDINSPDVDLVQTGVDTLIVSFGSYSRSIRVVVIPPFKPEFKIYPNPDTIGAIITNIDTSFNVYCNANGFVNDYGKIYYDLYRNGTLVSDVNQYGSLYLHLYNNTLGNTTITVDSNGYIPFTNAIQLRLIDSNFTGTYIKTTANWHTDGEYLLIFKLLQVDSGSVSGGIMSGGNVIDTLDTDTIRMLIKTLPELIHIPDVDSIATDINYNYRLFLHANGYYHDSGRIHYRLYHQGTPITNVSTYGSMIMDNIPLINGEADVYPANVLIGNLDTSVKQWIPLNVNWKVTGTYTLIFDLYQYTFPFMVLTSDTIQMRVVYKLLPDLTVSPILDTGMTDYDYYFGLNLHANEYLKDSGRIQYSIYHNGTLVSDLSNYGNFQFANALLTDNPGYIFPQTFLMGDKDSSLIDSIPLLFNWLETGNYTIVFELFQYENDYPFASLVFDTMEIYIVKRILPVLTHQPEVDSLTKNISYNYGLILHANDYDIDSGCIHYRIYHENNIIDTLSRHWSISIDSISLTNSTSTVPLFITYIENLDSIIRGEIPIVVNWSDTGNYTLIFDLYSYKNGDTVKVLARDTIIMHVGNRKLPILSHTPEVDSITKDITYQYELTLQANDYKVDSGLIHYRIYYEETLIDSISYYGIIQMDNNNLTVGSGYFPHKVFCIGDKDKSVIGNIPLSVNWGKTGNYKIIFDLYQYENNRPFAVLESDTIKMRVVNKQLPELSHFPSIDTISKDAFYRLKLFLHANEYLLDSGLINFKIYYENSLIDTFSNHGNLQFDQDSITNANGTIPSYITRFDSLDSNSVGEIPILMDWFKTGNYTFIFNVYQYVNQTFFAELTTDTISFTVIERYLPYDSIVLPPSVLAPPSTIDTVYLNLNKTYDFDMYLKVQDSSASYYWNRYVSLDYRMYADVTLMQVIPGTISYTFPGFLPDTVLNGLGSLPPSGNNVLFSDIADSLIIHSVNWHDTGVYTIIYDINEWTDDRSFSYATLHTDTIVMIVMPGIVQFVNDTICAGEIYTLDTFNIQTIKTQTGYIHLDTIFTHNMYGCDSTIYITLYVNPIYTHTDTVTICDSELPLIYGDSIFTHAGEFVVHFNTVNKCDSTINLTLYVNPTFGSNDTVTICDSELPLNYGDSILHNAGIFYVHFNTVLGCDSLVVVTLNVNPTYAHNDTVTICYSELPLNYGDSVLTNAGSYNIHFNTVLGCDSLIKLTLYVNPTYTHSDTVTICDSELPLTYGDSIFTHAGEFVVHFNTINTCDSTVNLTLYVNPTFVHTDTLTICDSELPYNYGDSILHNAGMHNVHFNTIVGCDSLVIVKLNVNPTYAHTDTVTICDSELPLTYGDSIFANAGNYDIHFNSIHGCDSLIQLTLYVNPTYVKTDTLTICPNKLPYHYGDSMLTQAGDFEVHFNSIHACDSTILLTLNVLPIDTIPYSDTICAGEVYNDHGFSYTSQITDTGYFYHQTRSSSDIYGCDSITLLSLYIRPFNSIQIKDSVCAGEQYDKNDFNISTVSSLTQYTLYDTNTNIDRYNCDSITYLQLTVLPNSLIHIKDTICPGDTYNKHNFYLTTNFTVSGYTVYDTNKNANTNFCDSISILQLYVKSADSTIIYDSICAGNTYNLHGFSINISPTTSLFVVHDTIPTTDLSGCDSISILQLVVFPVDSVTIVDTICAGATYTNNGFKVPTSFSTISNWEYDTLHYQNKYGCDSISMLKLFVKPVDSTFIHDTICGESTYTFNGKNIYCPASISPYTITETQKKSNQYGCDSTIMLFLYVKAVDSIYIYDTICSENNYSLHDFNITSTRTFTAYTIYDTNKNVNLNGCDSITILSLFIRPIDTLHIIDSICSGARYTAYGFDKPTFITLTSYIIYDTNLSIYQYGCDSLTFLSLIVLPVDIVYINDTICAGQHYNINGFDTVALLTDITYNISDTNYTINKNGCDSTTILNLNVLPVYISPDPVFPSEDICDKGMDYVFWSTSFGNTIKIPTAHLIAGTYIYYDTLQSSNGCDSMIYFTLRVHPTYEIKTIDEICDNETFIWRGHTFNPPHSGNKLIVYDSLTTTAHHCDSVFVLELTVYKNKIYEDTVDLCFDENSNPIFNQYTWYGHKKDTIITNLVIGNTYVIYDSLKTIHDCDSVYKHTLIIHPSYNHSDTLSICETELPYIYGDTTFPKGTTSNVYPVHFSLKSGCDSLVNLHLTVFPINITTIKDTICSGNHYVDYGFDTITSQRTTIYHIFDTLYLQNQYACDSIVRLQLTVLPVDSIHVFDTICSGIRYNDYGFDTLIPYTTKSYSIYDTIHTLNSNGCNAMIMLSLYIIPVDSIYINDTTYAGVHYTSYGFNIATIDSAFEYNLSDTNISFNTQGCDSITILNLMVLPLSTVIIHDTTCAGSAYVKNGFKIITPLSVSTYTIVDTNISHNINGYDSITTLILMVNPVDSIFIHDSICALEHYNKNGFDILTSNSSTKYIIYDTNYDFNQNGCDSITLLELTVFPKYIIDIYDTICKGESYVQNGFNIINPLPGSYFFDTTLISSKGCDSLVNLYLNVGPYIQHSFNDTSVCPGNSVVYSFKEDYAYSWSTHPSFNPVLSTDTAFSIQIFQDTTLYIKIIDTVSNGKVCQLTTSVKIYVAPHFTLNYSDTNACCSDTIEFIVHSFENYVYKWYSDAPHTKLILNGDSSLKYIALKDTVFYLTIVDTIGFCRKDTQLRVKIKPVIVKASLDTLTINGCDMTSIPLPVTNMSDLIVYMKPGAIIINECLNSVSVSWLKDYIISTSPIIVKRNYKIANECGMGDTISQFIYIIDTVVPQVGPDIVDTFYVCNWNLLNVPPATNAYSLIAYGFSISDNCTDTNNLIISHTDSIASNNKHKLIRTYAITDNSGNSNYVKHIIYISDTIAPSTNNLIDTLNQCDTIGIPPMANTIKELLDLGFIISDNCLKADSLILYKKDQTFSPNTCGGGTIVRSYEIMDSFQNKTIAYHTIEISDTTPPQVTDIITLIYDECDLQKIPPAATTIKQLSSFGFNISDNCQLDSTLILQKEIISNNICKDSILRIYNVKDACGNTSIFQHTIIVQDTTFPIVKINVKDTILYNTCTISNVFAPATTIDDLLKLGFAISDNCTLKQQITLLNENISSSKCSDTIIRTYRIEDLCDNAIEVTYTIYTLDTIKPVISDTIKLEKHADATNCIYYIPDLTTLIRNISHDNCTPKNELTIIQNKAAGSLITKSENVVVTVSDHCGNTNQKEVAVIIEGALSVTATANPSIICQLDSSFLKASTEGGYGKKTFIWSPPNNLNSFMDSVVISKALDTTTYTVIVTDESGCTAQTTVDLYVKPIPNFDLGNDIGVCFDSLYPIILNPGKSFSKYSWNTGATSPEINVMKEGIYSVKIENSYHCSSVDSIKIVDLTDLYVRIESLSDFCDKRQTVLKANTIASDVIWSTGEISKEIEITEAGTYYITASEMGCAVKDFFVIDPCQFRIFIPNAITPSDNNTLNDCFRLKIPETVEITSFEISIFDRFGNKVFHSKDLEFEWCGKTSNGGIAHDNVFTYIISLEENGKKYNYRGTILVL